MATREHQQGNTRIKVQTVHTDIIGSFIEWGGEAWRERRHKIAAVWWNPLTWNKHEWRREGTPPLTAVEFFRGNRDPISDSVLHPARYQRHRVCEGELRLHVRQQRDWYRPCRPGQ